MFEYADPVLRRGLVYTPGNGISPWQPRPVEDACRLLSSKSVSMVCTQVVGDLTRWICAGFLVLWLCGHSMSLAPASCPPSKPNPR
jgi:hypothetical protein